MECRMRELLCLLLWKGSMRITEPNSWTDHRKGERHKASRVRRQQRYRVETLGRPSCMCKVVHNCQGWGQHLWCLSLFSSTIFAHSCTTQVYLWHAEILLPCTSEQKVTNCCFVECEHRWFQQRNKHDSCPEDFIVREPDLANRPGKF